MRIYKNRTIKIDLKWKPKGERVRWKVSCESTKDNYHRIVNGHKFKYKLSWSVYIPMKHRFFWMFWVLIIETKPEILSMNPIRLVNFNDTHLPLLEIPLKTWDGQSVKDIAEKIEVYEKNW